MAAKQNISKLKDLVVSSHGRAVGAMGVRKSEWLWLRLGIGQDPNSDRSLVSK